MKNGKYELIIPPSEYPGKKYRGRYAYEHRVVWWKGTGLNPDNFPKHLIHHKNDSKRDNAATNLELMLVAAHTAHHARPVTMEGYICENCNLIFYRAKRGKKWHFCSRRCIGLYGFPKRKQQSPVAQW